MTDKPSRCRGPITVSTLALALIAGAPLATSAQVLEIDEAGVVTVHDGPEVISAAGAMPIHQPPRAAGETRARAFDHRAIADAATGAGLSPALVEAVAWRESRRRSGLVSPAGAIGEMQLMPGTAKNLGVNPFDSQENYRGGATYLGGLLKHYDGDVVRALAAYNAGPKAVDRYGGVPPYKETQDYVAAILDRLSRTVLAPSGR